MGHASLGQLMIDVSRDIRLTKAGGPPQCGVGTGPTVTKPGIRFSSVGVDKDFAKKLAEESSKLIKQFPQVKRGLQRIEFVKMDDYNGASSRLSRTVSLGKTQFSSGGMNTLKRELEEAFRSGTLATKVPIDVFRHEFGHFYHYSLSIKQKAAFQGFQKQMVGRVGKEISSYAAKNEAELFAEAFVRYRTGTATREVSEFFEKIGKLR